MWYVLWCSCSIFILLVLLLLFFSPPAQSGRHENWKLSKIMTTACYSVSNVLRKAIAFPLWSAIDSRWNRNTVSLVSPVTAAMCLPSSSRSSTESWFHAPAVSTATGKNVSGGQRITFDHFIMIIILGPPAQTVVSANIFSLRTVLPTTTVWYCCILSINDDDDDE